MHPICWGSDGSLRHTVETNSCRQWCSTNFCIETNDIFPKPNSLKLQIGCPLLRHEVCQWSQQGLLATFLVPGCVGRMVRLGSESSSGAGGGVWKSGFFEIWERGHPQRWDPTNHKNINYKNPNPFCTKCRQGLDQ